jgi:hypothetical protein
MIEKDALEARCSLYDMKTFTGRQTATPARW